MKPEKFDDMGGRGDLLWVTVFIDLAKKTVNQKRQSKETGMQE